MADTALTIITDALLDLGVLADEETPSASQTQGGLRKLNNLIDSWNLKSLNVYGAMPVVTPLIANQGIYTLTQTGAVQSAYVRDNSQPATQVMDIPITVYSDEQWQDVAFKGMMANYPYFGVWVNNNGLNQQVYVNPIPSASNYSLVLWISSLLANLALNDTIVFAPGYKRALTLGLQMELAPSYGVEISQITNRNFQDALDAIRTRNVDITPIKSALDHGYWSYRTGMWMNR